MKRWICILACVSLCLTGCSNIALSDREAGMISEYAAYVVLKHNKMYNSRLQDEVYETEPETTAAEPAQNPESEPETTAGGTQSATEDLSTLAQGLGLEGFEVEYTGYDTVKTYEDEYFNFSAVSDKILLVLHFTITNTGDQEKEADVLANQFKFRCTVNREKRVGSQLTMLLNDLYSFKEVLAPQEKKEAILIFQLPGKYENAIETLDFTVKNSETSHRYKLK